LLARIHIAALVLDFVDSDWRARPSASGHGKKVTSSEQGLASTPLRG
jgi:hypothetical protein